METDYNSRRTSSCGALTLADEGKEVVLKGWVDKRRDLGGLIFVDLRDRTGKTQIIFNPSLDEALHKKAEQIRSEFVISVKGRVQKRLDPNKKLSTGEIEVIATNLRILNKALTPPINMGEESGESEDIRLKYRFLDLRKSFMQKNIIFRHKVLREVRTILSDSEFIEIETPILMKSTPEGARDFLVPSRMNRGKFYALPQSPQTYKQILMVAGFDKYFQIAKCFRDEDLRADRQPEFTQIDCELSFVEPDEIYEIFSNFLSKLFKTCLNVNIGEIERITYQNALDKYGSDKPDTRFGMCINNISEICNNSEFKVFSMAIESGGAVKAILGENCATYSRKQMDDLTDFVKQFGAKGLVWLKVKDEKLEGPAAKFLSPEIQSELINELDAKPGDCIFIVADTIKTANKALGQLRLKIAKTENLLSDDKFNFLWVTDFPMFEYSETDKRWSPTHHPFTAPLDEDVSLLHSPDYHLARAKAYDIVLNGNEIGGGSIRIHDAALQNKIFDLLGIKKEEAISKFGFLLEAFKYGAPPHGGIAFGLDRLLMIMLKLDSIRDVIPFPKTTTGSSLMDGAPSDVSIDQLAELKMKIIEDKD